jgi:hypothetical protein
LRPVNVDPLKCLKPLLAADARAMSDSAASAERMRKPFDVADADGA